MPCCARRREAERPPGLPLVVPRPGLCTDNGAMIGAAGARRFAAGERAGLDLDARPSLPLAGGPDGGRPARRRGGPPDAARGRPPAAPRTSQNFLADIDVLEAILAEARPAAGRAVLEIGPGLGILTGGLLDAGAAVTAVELDHGLAARLADRLAEAISVARRTRRASG